MQSSVKERFKRIIQKHNYKQNHIAEILNTNPQGIYDILSGRKNISLEILLKLYENLQIDLNWLICGAGKMKINNQIIDQLEEPIPEYGNTKKMELLEEIRQLYKENIELRKEVQQLRDGFDILKKKVENCDECNSENQ